MDIIVSKSILIEAIKNLENNKKYFIIDKNLFLIDKIDTMKKVVSIYNTDDGENLYEKSFFKIVYNNETINFQYYHEDNTCQNFVDLCKLISANDVSALLEKSIKISSEKYKSYGKLCPPRDIDEIFKNEVLIFISSKINENDKDITTDDFISKYELFKEKQNVETAETIELMNKLYDMLLNIKIEDRGI